MAETYFVRFRGRAVGPYSLAQAQQMARKGQLSRTSEVSTDGNSWTHAAAFYEIFERPMVAHDSSIGTQSRGVSVAGEAGRTTGVDTPKLPSLNEWYYTTGDSQMGPTSTANIITMLNAGTLATQDRVWREGLDNWVSVASVPEFSGAVAAVVPQAVSSRAVVADAGAFCRECGERISRRAVICPKCGVPTDQSDAHGPRQLSVGEPASITRYRAAGTKKARSTAAILAFFLGGLGAHHFYLGNIVLGLIYLLFCMTFIPAVIALIEAIVYLCMSDEAFDAKYNN